MERTLSFPPHLKHSEERQLLPESPERVFSTSTTVPSGSCKPRTAQPGPSTVFGLTSTRAERTIALQASMLRSLRPHPQLAHTQPSFCQKGHTRSHPPYPSQTTLLYVVTIWVGRSSMVHRSPAQWACL